MWQNFGYWNDIIPQIQINSFEDISLFEKLFNQSKINLVKEKCIKQFNYITEKIENKAKAYKLTLSKQIKTKKQQEAKHTMAQKLISSFSWESLQHNFFKKNCEP